MEIQPNMSSLGKYKHTRTLKKELDKELYALAILNITCTVDKLRCV